ncbi:MAG: YhbY family RNA-binding protein [Candidatus Cloacimonetes bacterium]|jgi:RNA-binding protein|nr:YhbY family RNA-binding protein [Candidatus Cloacimonadota bacterium]MBT4332890.1 YhbY family RNA-binding protein [Candidatus Cloacimonadota bacterium]MBT5421182.1 YhbY family RNA-binding protein [Candidatus Cloacimonadota bacterium]
MKLTNKQKAKMKSMAQLLDAIVKIGDKGVTQTVISSMNEALIARELVKFSVAHSDRKIRKEMMAELAEATDAILVNIIGKTGLLFKINPDNPIISEELLK